MRSLGLTFSNNFPKSHGKPLKWVPKAVWDLRKSKIPFDMPKLNHWTQAYIYSFIWFLSHLSASKKDPKYNKAQQLSNRYSKQLKNSKKSTEETRDNIYGILTQLNVYLNRKVFTSWWKLMMRSSRPTGRGCLRHLGPWCTFPIPSFRNKGNTEKSPCCWAK